MVDESCQGFEGSRFDMDCENKVSATVAEVTKELTRPSPVRIWSIASAYERGFSVEDVHQLTKIDRWFLSKLYAIHRVGLMLQDTNLDGVVDHPSLLHCAKKVGYSDKKIA